MAAAGVLAGGKDMLLSKMLFGPFIELMNNRNYFGQEIWDTNALLADPGLILEPDFDRLAFGPVGDLRRDGRGEVFLNVSWASSSALGWRGLTDSLR